MSRRVFRHELNGKNILFFGTIKGLVDERKLLRELVDEFSPRLLLLGISPEELSGLRSYLQKPFDIQPDDYEVIYGLNLEKFGEVGLPVPTYLEAFAISKERNIEMLPLDMPDEVYSNLYLKKVEFYHLLLLNLRKKRVAKKKFQANTPEEFVLQWDREMTRLRPFREIEMERERYMAKRIEALTKERKEEKMLAVIEFERLHGVLDNLNLLHTI